MTMMTINWDVPNQISPRGMGGAGWLLPARRPKPLSPQELNHLWPMKAPTLTFQFLSPIPHQYSPHPPQYLPHSAQPCGSHAQTSWELEWGLTAQQLVSTCTQYRFRSFQSPPKGLNFGVSCWYVRKWDIPNTSSFKWRFALTKMNRQTHCESKHPYKNNCLNFPFVEMHFAPTIGSGNATRMIIQGA